MEIQTKDERAAPTIRVGPEPAKRAAAGTVRVLHVISYLGRGGTEHGVLKLVRGLDSGLFEHRICATRGWDSEFATGQEVTDKVYVAGRPEPTLQFPLFRLLRIIRSYKPHVVHSRNWGGIEAVLAARLAGVPRVIHSEHGYEQDRFVRLPLRRRLFRRAMYALADTVFTVTRELRDYHARQGWVSPERIQVIYNGVDTRRFAPCPEVRWRVRQELTLSPRSFVVGTVGRMVPIKDHGTLLKAAELLAERGIDVRVVLVGSGPELGRLKRQAGESPDLNGRIVFPGDSDRVPELLNAMDVFVLSSLGEGMSNTLLEAMACGLPTVASRAGGNPELVEDGQSGLLFSPGDVKGLAKRLEELASNREFARQLGSAARQRAAERFGLERMMDNYRSLYLGDEGGAYRGAPR